MDDQTLFNYSDFGILDAGVKAAKIDLDIPEVSLADETKASIGYFVWCHEGEGAGDLLAVVNFECPSWFEPMKRRLALNDLRWIDMAQPVNNIDDFDPWSQYILNNYWKRKITTGGRFAT